jgi:hypothetical protein
MKSVILQIAQADFLERTRKSNFLLVIFTAVILAYVFCPPRNGGYVTLIFGENYVGLFNSVWMGTSTAISISIFFSLIGFYMVSNAIQVDLETRVGQIIAASSLHKTKYLFGKFFSNFVILTVIVMITMFTAMVMQLIRGEDYYLNLWAYFAPFAFMLLPGMAVIAAIAIVFEVISFLRGTIGNIIFFVVWGFIIFSVFKPIEVNNLLTISDLFAQGIALSDIVATLQDKYPTYNGIFSNGLTVMKQKSEIFIWQGVHWNFSLIAGRSLWAIIAIILVLFASLFFSRFQHDKKQSGKSENSELEEKTLDIKSTTSLTFSAINLTPVKNKFSFFPILIAELKVIFSGLRWWTFIAVSLVVLSFILPFEAVKTFVWPVIWLWPLAIWSAMGSREKKYRTEELIYSSPLVLTRLFPITWFSGVVVSILISSGVAVRFFLDGNMTGLFVWLTGALFIPTLAITCGAFVNNNKLFEVLYLSIWYMGPLNQLPLLNFMDENAKFTAFVYLIITFFLLNIFFFLKKRKIYS